jgi:rhodanese-related sulfurtransferase
MIIRIDFKVLFVLLIVFDPLANQVAADELDNITGEDIGKQILANAPLSIQSGSDIDKARYAYGIYCDALADVNTSEDEGLVNSLTGIDHSEALKGIFLGMGISSNNSLEIVAGKINHTENGTGDQAGDGSVISARNNDSDAVSNGQDTDRFHAAAVLASVDRLHVFDPFMMARGRNGQYNESESSEWNGMDVREWSTNMEAEGYSVFKDEGRSWYYSVEEIEDKFFGRPSYAGEYRAELRPECDNCSQSNEQSADSDILKFIVLPDNEVIGIIEDKEESGDPYDDNFSLNQIKGAIYGYYDSRIKELGFIGLTTSRKIENKSYELFVTYDYVKSGQAQIVDARTPEEFGEGTIPGAVNIPYNLIYAGDRIKEDASLSAIFAGLDKYRPVVVYTSNGVKASSVVLALRILGYDARLYTYLDWLEHEAETSA